MTASLEANWAGAAYISLLILLVIKSEQILGNKTRRNWCLGSILISISFLTWLIMHVNWGRPLWPKDTSNRYHIYQPFKQELKAYYEQHLDKDIRLVSSNNYQIPAMLEFHLKPSLQPIAINYGTYHPVVHEFWHRKTSLKGQDLYYVAHGDEPSSNFAEQCASTEVLQRFSTMRAQKPIHRFSLFLCRNFQGRVRPLAKVKLFN